MAYLSGHSRIGLGADRHAYRQWNCGKDVIHVGGDWDHRPPGFNEISFAEFLGGEERHHPGRESGDDIVASSVGSDFVDGGAGNDLLKGEAR